MAIERSLDRQTSRALSALRIVVGLLFLVHGTSKFFGFPPYAAGPVSPGSMLWFQGLIELVGGGLLAAGLFTRIVAFVIAGDMAVAYFMAHAPKAFFPHANGGLAAVLYCMIFLFFIFAGGGAWSLDRLMREK